MKKPLLAAEFALLFFGLPTLYALRLIPIPMIPLLLLAAAGCFLALVFDRTFDRRQLWNAAAARRLLKHVVVRFLLLGAALTLFAVLFDRALFLSFVRRHPAFWAIVMVLYPLVSAYPQELIYRAFLFHRYRLLFRSPGMRIAVSAVTFGFLHVVFGNWLAVVLSGFGGVLFAATYHRSRSLFASSVEHGLYGDLVFTIGLGRYFVGGTLAFLR